MKTNVPPRIQVQDEKKPANSVKKALSTIYSAPTGTNGGKENLIGRGRNLSDNPKMKDTVEKVEFLKSTSNPKVFVYEDENISKSVTSNKATETEHLAIIDTDIKPRVKRNKITAEDLTNEVGPSEKFWELEADKTKAALKKTLEENQILHEKLELLKEENAELKEAMKQATDIINCLKDIIEDRESGEAEGNSEKDVDQSVPEVEETNSSVLSSPSSVSSGD